MYRRFTLFLFSLLLAAGALPAVAQTKMPQITYRDRTLKNGLRVLSVVDKASLTVDETNFVSERAVVQEEFRQSVLAPPYGKFFYVMQQKSFNTHPYKRNTIASIEDLQAATVENVRKFHTTYYRPDNATLIIVGDFDQKQLDAWVDKYFASIPKPATPLPRVQVKE